MSEENNTSNVGGNENLQFKAIIKDLKKIKENLADLSADKIKNKNKDNWDRFQIFSTFFSGVLIAGIGLFFTISFNTKSSYQQQLSQHSQDSVQKKQFLISQSELKIEQLKIVAELIPLLTSKDSMIRNYARKSLVDFHKTSDTFKKTKQKNPDIGYSLLVIEDFADEIIKPRTTLTEKDSLTRVLRKIAVNRNSPRSFKYAAIDGLRKVARSDRVPSSTRKIAMNALNEFDEMEKNKLFSARIHKDSTGQYIGYGHKLTENEQKSLQIFIGGKYVKVKNGLNKEQAIQLIDQDTKDFHEVVDTSIKIKLTANQRVALHFFVSDIGISGFRTSSVLRLINQNKLDSVPLAMLKWIRPTGMVDTVMRHHRQQQIDLWQKN